MTAFWFTKEGRRIVWAFSLKLTKRESICGLHLHLFCHRVCCEQMLPLAPLQQRPQRWNARTEEAEFLPGSAPHPPWQGQLHLLWGPTWKGNLGSMINNRKNVTKRAKLCFFLFFLSLSLDLQCFYLLFNITPSKEKKLKVLMWIVTFIFVLFITPLLNENIREFNLCA